MRLCRPVLCVLAAAWIAATAGAVRAEAPDAGLRERQWYLARATEHFEARRYEQSVASFEAAARVSFEPLPVEALRRWGIAASESGWPLAAYVRLRQYAAVEPTALDREALEQRVARARRTLLETAKVQSRVVALAETRPSSEMPGERQVVRLVGRQGRATVEALAGVRVMSPGWERAGEIQEGEYVALVSQLLDAPAVLGEWPHQSFDPNAEGPRRAVVLRLVVGEEERVRQALRGEPYESLHALTEMILDFARKVQVRP